MSANMSRKLNALEQKIHQAALSADDRTVSGRELEALAPDQGARTTALNFLLGAGLLKAMKDAHGRLAFRAVVKKELEAKKDLSGEETLVFGHIQAAGNEGIWTKHIKVKTELHQTVIDRCLKSLTQKKLVKCISGSVQHPTRKIYMLFHLEPSTEMTGGPWYTDKELDTEFIKLLTAACLKFIRDRSFPRSRPGDAAQQRLLYPPAAAPAYPTAAQVQAFLNKSRITETQLSVEHVEMLLHVLVLDGDVEKVPALGAALWESTRDDGGSSAEEEAAAAKGRKRRRADDGSRRRKKRRKAAEEDGSEAGSDAGGSRRAKSRAGRRRAHDSDAESDASESEEDERRRRKKKKNKAKRRRARESSDDDESSEAEARSRKRARARRASSSSSDSGSDSAPPRAASRTKREASSPAAELAFDADAVGGAHVYRAVHAERMARFGLGQAPCGHCPVFDFCKTGGPVNAQACGYYGDWLDAAEAKVE
ncbi:hypothetical protein PHLGIDRAFT_130315 [Phlebiopsis gigantea 11061_1 CR5-6]|uniref:DNA-directed RNA polymerase III subunit RPC6 n=1 Tax=Phlebiopsis gigantea (strain 11061_1 CR5-6) TaxID=745531 RepID=A0A0C3RS78_PHLG1|nr:hypothetical protein PHLGIDRAFT_130315 [Phlebiopsis gigantea 11061_1 CR5-6]